MKTFKKASLAENAKGDRVIMIDFSYDIDTLFFVRELPGRQWHANQKCWSAPLFKETIEALIKNGFELDHDLHEVYAELRLNNSKILKGISGLKGKLYPFQAEGVAFIDANKGRALIADEMGLGKTIQAIGWLQLHSEARPAVIVVPKSLKLNWEKELNKWLEKPIINVLSGSGKDIRKVKGDIIIINYDILPVWLDRIKSRDPQVLITDECHFYKNNQAKRTKAVKRLAKGIPNVIALSGTPIQNRPIEIYNAITIIKPELFPNYIKFRERYCNPKFNGFGWTYNGASHIAELHNILVNSVMLRRLKKDVLTDLPDKTNAFVPLELDNRATYEAAKHNLIAFLRQFKGSRAAEKAMRAEALVKLGTLKQLAAKGKLHNAIDWIEEFLNVEDKLVVFAIHKEIIDALMQAFGTIAVKIDGSVSSLQREKAVEKFQNDPKIKLFVGNITAAGVGLTLTASSNVAFLELPWTPGSVTQAADRCHRIGQKDNVTIHFLLAENTIDEDMAKLIDKKQMILDNVLDGKDTSEESLISELFKIYEV